MKCLPIQHAWQIVHTFACNTFIVETFWFLFLQSCDQSNIYIVMLILTNKLVSSLSYNNWLMRYQTPQIFDQCDPSVMFCVLYNTYFMLFTRERVSYRIWPFLYFTFKGQTNSEGHTEKITLLLSSLGCLYPNKTSLL